MVSTNYSRYDLTINLRTIRLLALFHKADNSLATPDLSTAMSMSADRLGHLLQRLEAVGWLASTRGRLLRYYVLTHQHWTADYRSDFR